MRRVALVGLAVAGVALGLLAEQEGYAWSDPTAWLVDLLAGWALMGCGLALAALRRSPGAATLLLAVGFSWFVPNLATTGPAATEWLAAHAVYLHRGPLFALALAVPTGHPRSRLASNGVGAAWIAALVWPFWDRDGTALLLCAAMVGVAWTIRARAAGQHRRASAARGLAATVLVCAAIAADALRSLAGGAQTVTDGTVLGYAVAVAIAGAVLFEAASRDAAESLAERAVELGRSSDTLRDALRDLLGDHHLEVGAEPDAARERGLEVTPVSVGEGEVAVITHEPGTLDDPLTRAAVLAAVGMTAERDRLRMEVGRQVDAVAASRRRLLLADEGERARLARRIERGPGMALGDVERHVGDAAAAASPELSMALRRASDKLDRIRPELDALVRGLGGVDAAGLTPALERLAADLPIACELELGAVDVPPEVATALWFIAAETLANAVKHADASSVSVLLTADANRVALEVADDGRGGADPGGPGLVGLADRVTALGGRLEVDSPLGRGTRVVARLPRVTAPV